MIKSTLKTAVAFFVGALFIMSCDETGDKATLMANPESPELAELSTTTFSGTFETQSETFQTFEWSAVDFGFQAAVTYTLQIDVEGNDFADAVNIISVSNATTVLLTKGQFNAKLLELELEPDEEYQVEARIQAKVNNSSIAPAFSQSVVIQATPFATTFPPIFGMGAALNGWGPWNSKEVEFPSVAPNVYETTARFTNGETFRWFKQADWGPDSYNYLFFSSVSNLFENGNDGDKNLRYIGPTGFVKVTVNLKLKTVTAVGVPEPTLFMMGAGVNGWGPWNDKEVKMTFVKDGVFEATTNLNDGGSFRFFAQADWGPTSYNYLYFTTVGSLLKNANDGDKNFQLNGTNGAYKITVNLKTKVVTVVAAPI
ncbi:MAG: SusE domain-containing protein [Cytophagales bacterium]|jgi:hypothetical protein|nr:SusE domain-containing protein [Cytophagales bacterium]